MTEAELADHLQTAIKHHQQGNIHKADEHYRKVLDQDRDNVDMLHYYGLLQCQHGNKVQGLAMIERAIHLNPEYYDALNNLGNVLVTEGRFDEAAELFHQCHKLNPAASGPLVNLGTVKKKQGEIDTAIGLCLQALELEPGSRLAYISLIDLYTINKEYKAALDILNKTLDVINQDDQVQEEAHFRRRGALLNILGRKEEAQALYAEFTKRYPDNAIAKHMAASFSAELKASKPPEKPDNEFVRQTFDHFAENFDQVLANLDYKAPELVGNLVKERYEPESAELVILDAGCGTGLCGQYLKACSKSLVGMDISSGMLKKARITGYYDELHEAEIEAFLAEGKYTYNLVVSADTFCYFGVLDNLFKRISESLQDDGAVIFTVETTSDPLTNGYHLQSNGRYQHSEDYVLSVIQNAGLGSAEVEEVVLRMERSQPVKGLLVMAHKM